MALWRVNKTGAGAQSFTYTAYSQNVNFTGDNYIKIGDGILINGSVSRGSVSQPPTIQLFVKVGSNYEPVTDVISPQSAGQSFVANDTLVGEIFAKKVGGGDFTTTAFTVNYGSTT